MHPPKTSPRAVRRTLVVLLSALGVTFASMLIWRKLRIVTGVPRTAYAQPEQTSTPHRHASTPTDDASDAPR